MAGSLGRFFSDVAVSGLFQNLRESQRISENLRENT